MSDKTKAIDSQVKLRAYMAEQLPALLREAPEVLIAALAEDPEALGAGLRAAGFEIHRRVTPDDIRTAHSDARRMGFIDPGFGGAARQRCHSVEMRDPRDGVMRTTFLVDNETEELAFDWYRAFFTRNHVSPITNRSLVEIHGLLEERTIGGPKERAPTDPFLGEIGEAGGSLVPTIIAAEIFEIMNERFPLKGMIQIFQSNTPLTINRRTVEIVVTRDGVATDIGEDKPEVGPVRLSPERVGVISYIDPKLAQASPVGAVRYVTEQIAEAMAKDDQRVIITGSPGLREPRGVLNLPTTGGQVWDRADTVAYDDSDVLSERASMKEVFYGIPQKHRQSAAAAWVTNDDGLREFHSHNDTDQKPFGESLAAGQPETYLRKPIVESLAIVTAGGDTQAIFGDWNQYGWLEGSEGLKLDQTTVGGQAWEADVIGVKAVQYVDGAPITPPAFSILTSIDV